MPFWPDTVSGLATTRIVMVHEVGVCQGQHYLVMNLVQGPPLSRLVAHAPLPALRAATYLRTVAEAIHHAPIYRNSAKFVDLLQFRETLLIRRG